MNVTGDGYTTYYTQIMGAGGPTGKCFFQCDYPMHYFFIGELNRTEQQGVKGCAIEGEITALYDVNDVKKYGDCPDYMIEGYSCVTFTELPKDKKWKFVKDDLVDVKSEVPEEKATLSRVKFTQFIQNECNWKTESK